MNDQVLYILLFWYIIRRRLYVEIDFLGPGPVLFAIHLLFRGVPGNIKQLPANVTNYVGHNTHPRESSPMPNPFRRPTFRTCLGRVD